MDENIWFDKTIFIVEDEKLNSLLLDKFLSKIGIQTIHAKNGRDAVNYCRVNHNIDLVLMDIRMPVMDGLVATKLIKEFRDDLPIIAQTAYISADDMKKIRETGFDDYISKPIRKEVLFKMLKKHFIT